MAAAHMAVSVGVKGLEYPGYEGVAAQLHHALHLQVIEKEADCEWVEGASATNAQEHLKSVVSVHGTLHAAGKHTWNECFCLSSAAMMKARNNTAPGS